MVEPCTFIIFGSTGNLARTKLLPALFHLERAGRLPDGMCILGTGRRDWQHPQWQEYVREILVERESDPDKECLDRFIARLRFFTADITNPASFRHLKESIENDPACPGNLVFYMALQPSSYASVASSLAEVGLNTEEGGWRRLVIEKPFGYDLESAEILEERLHRHFTSL